MIDAMGKALQEKMTGYQEEMLRHFKALLRINSVRGERRSGAPFGPGNREALDYVLGLSRRFGLEQASVCGSVLRQPFLDCSFQPLVMV